MDEREWLSLLCPRYCKCTLPPHLWLLHSFSLLLWYKHLIAEEFALWRERGLSSSCIVFIYLFVQSEKGKVSLPVFFFLNYYLLLLHILASIFSLCCVVSLISFSLLVIKFQYLGATILAHFNCSVTFLMNLIRAIFKSIGFSSSRQEISGVQVYRRPRLVSGCRSWELVMWCGCHG